jgi:hypothetical protein
MKYGERLTHVSSTREAEAGRSRGGGQPEQPSKTLSQKKIKRARDTQ